jgi:hypothetical protein
MNCRLIDHISSFGYLLLLLKLLMLVVNLMMAILFLQSSLIQFHPKGANDDS